MLIKITHTASLMFFHEETEKHLNCFRLPMTKYQEKDRMIQSSEPLTVNQRSDENR